MADHADPRQDLLARINTRRAGVEAFLREKRPRIRRRATATLVLTSLSAVFTAGPALGGVPFADSVQNALNLSDSSVVWRTLCFLALLVSVTAAVVTNVSRSHDAVAQLSAVEAADAELEGLSTLLEFGHLSVEDAVKLYQQYVTKIAFVDDVSVAAAGGPRSG
jgi:cytochrome bd-type quinol oxidase subunit 2